MFQELLLKLGFLLPLTIQEPSVELNRHVVWIEEDPAAPLTSPEAALKAMSEGKVQGPSAKGPNLGFKKNPVWLLSHLKNETSEDTFVLNFDFPGLDAIQVYQITGETIKVFPSIGDQVSPRNRTFSARTSNLKLHIPPQSETWLLYRIKTDSAFQGGSTLQAEATFIDQQFNENALLWSIYGMIAIMAAYHIFIWLSLKQAIYGFYTIYLALTVIAQMSVSGHYMSNLLVDHPEYSNTQVFGAGLAFVALYEFTIGFLDLKNTSKKSYRILRFLQSYIFASYLIWASLGFFAYMKIATATQIIHPITLLVIGILALRRGQKEARFFVLAFTVFMLGVMVFMGKQAGLFAPSILIQMSIPVTSAIQVTLMALALGDRLQLIEKRSKQLEEEQKLADAQHKEEILKLNASLEQRVEEQTRDIRSMLENTKIGLFSITQDLSVHKDYARFLESLLETREIAGRPLVDIFLARADLGPDAKHKIMTTLEYSIGEEEMFFEANADNLPRECTMTSEKSGRKHLDLDWSPVLRKDGTVEKVLVSLRDVTETLKLRQQAEEQGRNLRYMAEIINLGPIRFERFEKGAIEMWQTIQTLIAQSSTRNDLSAEEIRQIYVAFHTIKGAARMLHLSELTDLIHEAEELTAGKVPPQKKTRDCIAEALLKIQESQQRYRKAAEPLFNIRAELLAQQKLLDMGPSVIALAQEARGMIQQMAPIMDKAGCRIQIDIKEDILVTSEFYQAMLASLIHLVRNCLDHGIESKDERLTAGKQETGLIRIWIDQEQRLAIGDDGRGMNLKKLEAKAKEKDYAYSSEEQLCELIFASGVSTKDSVDQISGRGVGMDAVRSFLKAAQSEIHIVKLKREGDFLKFYFAIDIARSEEFKKALAS